MTICRWCRGAGAMAGCHLERVNDCPYCGGSGRTSRCDDNGHAWPGTPRTGEPCSCGTYAYPNIQEEAQVSAPTEPGNHAPEGDERIDRLQSKVRSFIYSQWGIAGEGYVRPALAALDGLEEIARGNQSGQNVEDKP